MWFGVHGSALSESLAPGCESPVNQGGRASLSLQVETTLLKANRSLINTKPQCYLKQGFPFQPCQPSQLTKAFRRFGKGLGSFGLGWLKNHLPEEADARCQLRRPSSCSSCLHQEGAGWWATVGRANVPANRFQKKHRSSQEVALNFYFSAVAIA